MDNYLKDYDLSEKSLKNLKIFKDFLLEYNQKTNITRITEEEEFYVKHYLDSLSLLDTSLIQSGQKILDLGTGGGFPGMPLKIQDESLEITLLDSLNKRIVFLNEAIKKLGLEKISAIHGRAEELARDPKYRETYDIVTSRAVANLRTLVEYAMGFVKVGGYFISMKGPEYEEELKEAKNAIDTMGGQLEEVISVELPLDITHYLLIVKKVRPTPEKYPRGGGKPRKNPL